MKSLFHIKSSEASGSSLLPPQYFLSLEVVGGPPHSPGSTPVDHFRGFFLGSNILVGIWVWEADCCDVDDEPFSESCGKGVAEEVTDIQQVAIAIVILVSPSPRIGWREIYEVLQFTSVEEDGFCVNKIAAINKQKQIDKGFFFEIFYFLNSQLFS